MSSYYWLQQTTIIREWLQWPSILHLHVLLGWTPQLLSYQETHKRQEEFCLFKENKTKIERSKHNKRYICSGFSFLVFCLFVGFFFFPSLALSWLPGCWWLSMLSFSWHEFVGFQAAHQRSQVKFFEEYQDNAVVFATSFLQLFFHLTSNDCNFYACNSNPYLELHTAFLQKIRNSECCYLQTTIPLN